MKGLEDGDKLADSPRLKKKNLYLMAYLLSGQKLMQFGRKRVQNSWRVCGLYEVSVR